MTPSLESLSEREREVLRLLARGHDAKSIASTVGISVHAVNERLREARRKLGLSSSRAAARMLLAAENGDERPQKNRPEEIGIASDALRDAESGRSALWVGSRNMRLVFVFMGGIMLITLIWAVVTTSSPIQEAPPASPAAARPSRIPMPIDVAQVLARENFPPDALRRAVGPHSRVAWSVDVNAAGRATNCTITRPSGVPDIDNTVCGLIMDRQIYRPATDAAGRPTPGSTRGFIDFEWSSAN